MSKLSNAQISKMYDQALNFQSQKKWQDALDIYVQLLIQLPDSPEVHFQVGTIFYAGSKFERSIFHLQIASLDKPDEPVIWDAFTKALVCGKDSKTIKAQLKRLQKAKLSLLHANSFKMRLNNRSDGSSVNPRGVSPRSLLEIQSLLNTYEFNKAHDLAHEISKKYPKSPALLNLLGQCQQKLNKNKQAKKTFEQAIALDPTLASAYIKLADLEFTAFNDFKSALEHLKIALLVAPRSTEAVAKYVTIYESRGHFQEAEYMLKNAAELYPNELNFRLQLRDFFTRQNKHEDAVKTLEDGASILKDDSMLNLEMGISYATNGQSEQAEQCYNRAIKQDPDNGAAYYRLSMLKLEEGNISESQELIKTAIKLNPNNSTYLRGYSSATKFEGDDPIIDQMIDLYENAQLPISEQLELGFSIVKALEDSKQFERVFHYLKDVNDKAKAEHPYDMSLPKKELEEIKDIFSDFDLQQYEGIGFAETAPIFVCGMPRSGTTLVEQIISSHSKIDSAGELGVAYGAGVATIKKNDLTKLPIHFNNQELIALGKEIDEKQRRSFPNAINITDKTIQTYRMLGIIKAAMPNCKIVVVRRDPRDNLLSIYRNKFVNDSHGYAYDLRILGEFYNVFTQTLDFWREKMPNDFYEIQYENIITNPEDESRKLIDFCDLEWEDACLNFHQSKNRVKTLSIVQVRQPIYKSSVKAWQRYEEHLQPMFDALKEGGNYPTDD